MTEPRMALPNENVVTPKQRYCFEYLLRVPEKYGSKDLGHGANGDIFKSCAQ